MDNFSEIYFKLNNALSELFKNDRILIKNNINERTISHRLAIYLQKEFQDYDVDCEYNRHCSEIKTIEIPRDKDGNEIIISWDDSEQKTIFPDIIVHKRNNDMNNLVVIEIKKSTNFVDKSYDENKLKSFTRNNSYNYKYGIFIFIDIDCPDSDSYFKIFQKGKLIEKIKYHP